MVLVSVREWENKQEGIIEAWAKLQQRFAIRLLRLSFLFIIACRILCWNQSPVDTDKTQREEA